MGLPCIHNQDRVPMQQSSSCQLVYWYRSIKKIQLSANATFVAYVHGSKGQEQDLEEEQGRPRSKQTSRLLGDEDLPVTPHSQWCYDSFEAGLRFYLAQSHDHCCTSYTSRFRAMSAPPIIHCFKRQEAKILWSGPVMNRLHVSRRLRLSYSIAPSACMVGWL